MKITNVLFGLNKKSDFIFEQNGKAFPDKQPYSSRNPKCEEKPLGSSPVKRSGDFLSCSPTSCIGLWGARCGWGEVQVLPLPCSSWDTGTAREGTWHSSSLRGRETESCASSGIFGVQCWSPLKLPGCCVSRTAVGEHSLGWCPVAVRWGRDRLLVLKWI